MHSHLFFKNSVKSTANLLKVAQGFAEEISLAKKNKSSKLSFDLNDLQTTNNSFSQKLIQVFYIGGSHLEIALVKKNKNGSIKIIDFISKPIETIQNQSEFLNLIKENYNPKANLIQLNLAAQIQNFTRNGLNDGILIKNHRDHNLAELVGKQVGKVVEDFLEKEFGQKIRVSSCNNLVSLGFLDEKKSQGKESSSLFGIVATGVNLGFMEASLTSSGSDVFGKPLISSENEPLGKGIDAPQKFINLESGKFEINQTESSKLIGESHLWKRFNSLSTERKIDLKIKNKQDFRNLIQENNPLALEILETSAKLMAAKIAGLIFYKQKTDSNFNSNNIKFYLEGSLFWEVGNYKQIVIETLEKLGILKQSLNFVRIQHGFILGAVKALIKETKTEKKRILFIQKVYNLLRKFEFSLRGPPLLNLVYNFN